MLGSTSVSAFGRERQNRAQSVLADLVDAFIPPTLDLGYAERSKIIQFARYHLTFHSFPSVDPLAVDRDMRGVISKVDTRTTPVGSAEMLAELYGKEMPRTAVAAGLTDDGDEFILPSILSLLLSLSGDPCGVERSVVNRVTQELQHERAENAARYDHLGRLREGLEEKRMLEAIVKASVETGWELAMAACDSSSDEEHLDKSISTHSGGSTPPPFDLPVLDPLWARAGVVPVVEEESIKCADDLTRECWSSLLTVESTGHLPEDLLVANADIIAAIVSSDHGRRRPLIVSERFVVEEVFTACYALCTSPVEEGSIVCLNTLFYISEGVLSVHAAITRGDRVACAHLSPRALTSALVSIARIMTDLLVLTTLQYLPPRYDHRRSFLGVQAEVNSLVQEFVGGLEAMEEEYSVSEVACSLVAITCALKRLARPVNRAALALSGEGLLITRLWYRRRAGCKVADRLYQAYTDPLLSAARSLACKGTILGDHLNGTKEMVTVLETIAADPGHPLQVIMTRTLSIHSSVSTGWAVQGYDDCAKVMGLSSETRLLLEHRLAARSAGSHSVRDLLSRGGGDEPPLNAIFKALLMVCMAFDEHVQEWLGDPGPRGPVWASRYHAWVKPHVMDITGVDIDIDALGSTGVRLPTLTSQQAAVLTPLALQFYSKVFDVMKALYEAQACIVTKPRCPHSGVLKHLFAVRAELLHFVRTLECYLKQSVIEPESRRFASLAADVDSLEALSHLHFHDYLHGRLARSLFMSPRTAVVRDALLAMLLVCKSYRAIAEKAAHLSPPNTDSVQEGTCDSVSSFDASVESYPCSRGTATTDQWTEDDSDPIQLLSELTDLRRSFKSSCRGLLNVLAVAAKDDRSVCHDLAMRINYAHYYSPPR